MMPSVSANSSSPSTIFINGDEIMQESFKCVLNQLAGTFSSGTNQNGAVSPVVSTAAYPSFVQPSPICPPASNATTLSLNLPLNYSNHRVTTSRDYCFDEPRVSQSHQSYAWSTSTTEDCLSRGSSGSGTSPVSFSNQNSPFEPPAPSLFTPATGNSANGSFGSFSLFSMGNDGLGGPIGHRGQKTASFCDALSSYPQLHHCTTTGSRTTSSSSGSSCSFNSDRSPPFQAQGQGLDHVTSVRHHMLLNSTTSTPTKVNESLDLSHNILEFAEMRRALSLVAASSNSNEESCMNALNRGLNNANNFHRESGITSGMGNTANPWNGNNGLQPQQIRSPATPMSARYANEGCAAVERQMNVGGDTNCGVGPGVPQARVFIDPGKTAGQYSNPGFFVGNPPRQMTPGGGVVQNNDQQRRESSKVDTGLIQNHRSKSLGDGYDDGLYWSNKHVSSAGNNAKNPTISTIPGDCGGYPPQQPYHHDKPAPIASYYPSSHWGGDPSEVPRKHSLGSTWLPSELTGRHNRNSFVEPGSGMRDVPGWLKALRLHKYSPLFSELSYDEMIDLTESQLEQHGVTKGARNKIVISIRKLKERYNVLRQFEDELTDTGKVRTGLMEELRSMVSTPIRQFPPLGKPVADQRLIDGVDVNPSELDCNNLPAHFTRVAWKAGSLMLSNASRGQFLDEDSCSALLHIVDRCSYHEAFTSAQKRKLSALKRQLLRVWRPPPRRARTWQGQYHYHHHQQKKASWYNNNPTSVVGPDAVKQFNSQSHQQCTVANNWTNGSCSTVAANNPSDRIVQSGSVTSQMTPVCRTNSLAAASTTTVPTTSQLHYGCTQSGTNNSSIRLLDLNQHHSRMGQPNPHYTHHRQQQPNPSFLTNSSTLPFSSDPKNDTPFLHHNHGSQSQDHPIQSTTPPEIIRGIITPPKSPEIIWRSHAGAIGDKRRPTLQQPSTPPLKATEAVGDLVAAPVVKDPWRTTPLDICSLLANVYIASSEGFGMA